MKRNNILLVILLLFFCWGCTRKLDRIPQDQISSNTFWTSPNDALLELNGCYGSFDGGYGDAYFEGYADNAFCQFYWESAATMIGAGNIDATIDAGYNNRYAGIRRFNYFLDNVNKTPGLSESLMKRYIAEVRFLRAYTYFNLAQLFGPVPLLKNAYKDPSDAAKTPASEDEVIVFVISELKACAENLPASYPGGSGNEVGRITKGAAVAFLARVELTYGKYSDAVAAAQQVMGMGYELYKKAQLEPSDMAVDYSTLVTFANNTDKKNFYKGLASYEQQFWQKNENNPEVILSSQRINNSPYVFGNGLNTLFLPGQWSGWSSITPTQELVNDYWNRDGSKFTPPTSEYRAQHFNKGNPDADWLKEFENRDTRLYASILFPTCKMLLSNGVTTFTWSGPGSNLTNTGYNFRKLVDATFTVSHDGGQDFPLIRYAEILLTYAEAKNEVSGTDQSVYDALNQIRNRAGMPDVDQAVYNSKDKLRELIRQERRIELAAEGNRYNDIRRWGIASKVMKDIKSINNEVAQARIWKDNYIRLPYPQSAVDHNPNLKSAQAAKGY